MRTLALDPGTTETGYVLCLNDHVAYSGVLPNADILAMLRSADTADLLAVEMISSFGMPVGRETFETVFWIGRFVEAWGGDYELIYRKDIKLKLCGSARAKDPNIRQALIDRFGAPGTKKNPGPTYGVKSHAWSALAVAACSRGMTL